jgi:hypothetical protein
MEPGVGVGLGVGLGTGVGLAVGVGEGSRGAAFVAPQPITASIAAAAAMVIANFWRRSNAKVEKIRNVTRRVAATGNFIEVASSANDGPWGTGESFASNGAHSRGGESEALLFEEDAAALGRDAAAARIKYKFIRCERKGRRERKARSL